MGITVKCPNCGNTSFNETGMAPTSTRILTWKREDNGLAKPDDYDRIETFTESEELDDRPFECTECQTSYRAIDLITEG